MMNWPNLVTCVRLVLIPAVVLCYGSALPYANAWAAALFTAASLSDWLDGYLARRLGQATPFGAFLDPVADKLLVVTVLALLATVHGAVVPAAAVIIGREIMVSALRVWMAVRGKDAAVAVDFGGKVKTAFQMTAIVALMLAASMPDWFLRLGLVLIHAAALLSVWSMARYFRGAWKALSS